MGRYLCSDCWTLYWDDHPQDLADDETRRFVAEEAKQIRFRRQESVVFQEGQNKVYLSSRGTLVFDIKSKSDLAPNEYDADRLAFLVRAMNEISGRKDVVVRTA